MNLMAGDCFFLILASFDLLIVGVEVYFHPLSLIDTRTHARTHARARLLWTRVRRVAKTSA